MQAKDIEVVNFLGANAQFFVPNYQRDYSWQEKNCRKLLKDIINVAEDASRPTHYIGSIVYISEPMNISGVTRCMVIDGQQRLTTISLLLIALGEYTVHYCAKNNLAVGNCATKPEALRDKYIFNQHETGDLIYKLKLKGEDFAEYKSIIADSNSVTESSGRVARNYRLLLNRLKALDIAPQIIFSGIIKLKIVDTRLDANENGQLVFESVNSTGLPLSAADKIRNFLIMNFLPSEQNYLYDNHWRKIEQNCSGGTGSSIDDATFEEFFRSYLTAVLNEDVPRIDRDGVYYDLFKDYFYSAAGAMDAKAVLYHLEAYSANYRKLQNLNGGGSNVDKIIYRIRTMSSRRDAITPLLLKVMYDLQKNAVSDLVAEEFLGIVEIYFTRRYILGFPTNSNGRAARKMLKAFGEQDKVSALKDMLRTAANPQRLPTDEDMHKILLRLPLFELGLERTRFVLDTLENYGVKEKTPVGEYTVEHIMPQSLSDAWKSDLGSDWQQIYDNCLNVIGNLTLTGYNSEYRNRVFAEKLDCLDEDDNHIGYKYTPIRLSDFVRKQTVWGEAQIIERTRILADKLINIWKYPL